MKMLERDAVISECGRYRYTLRRTWEHDKARVLFVMLNPSTADASIDDATIRSCIRLSTELGYGGFEVVNLFAFRATDPEELQTHQGCSMIGSGNENDEAILRSVARCDLVICAWGAHPAALRRAEHVYGVLRRDRPAVFCFGKTKSGAPKHPLYIKTGTPLEVYRGH